MDNSENIARQFWNRFVQFSDETASWDDVVAKANAGEKRWIASYEGFIDIAETVLNRTYPVLESIEDLEALPVGSVVTDSEGWWVYQSDYYGPAIPGQPRDIEWASANTWWKTQSISLPATLVYVPLSSGDY